MNTKNALTAISPVDGRYFNKVSDLSNYYSELALIKYRVKIEVEYFIALSQIPLPQLTHLTSDVFDGLRKIYFEFDENDAQRVKEIEKTTNHDVKAVEYFIKEKIDNPELSESMEFVHFGLTSQDINNTAIPLSIKDGIKANYLPLISQVIEVLASSEKEWENISMLAKTHGQPASPTRLGKEIGVFVNRLEIQLEQLKSIPYSAKFGGATGNMNAHYVSYPEIDWHSFANDFVNSSLGLNRSFPTTQIEHYDNLAALFDCLKRINTILVDLSRDVWTYVSMNYFKQKIKKNEVGSSAMPHKVNPIDFENAEGNFGIANALFEHLSAKLPVSRLQRDLTDSTVMRNIGVPMAHTTIALKSLITGWSKLQLNQDVVDQDLEENWAVLAEALQTILRREGYPKPYEKLKELTRKNERINKDSIRDFIENLDVSESIKNEMKGLTPFNYVGR